MPGRVYTLTAKGWSAVSASTRPARVAAAHDNVDALLDELGSPDVDEPIPYALTARAVAPAAGGAP